MMKRLVSAHRVILLMVIIASFFCSRCIKFEVPNPLTPEDSVLVFVDDLMNTWYYWYEQVPEVEVLSYESPEELLEDLKYEPLDRWSFMEEEGTITSLFEGHFINRSGIIGWPFWLDDDKS